MLEKKDKEDIKKTILSPNETKGNTTNLEGETEGKGVGDDSAGVLNLRNLYRQNRIDKSQYIGGLATLVATGLITKSEFTRLKAAAN